MLNRRQIRIRTMQALYAYEKARGANYMISQEMIETHFSPDLNSMEFQDKKLLEGKRKLGLSLLQEKVFPNQSEPSEPDDYTDEIRQAVSQAYVSYLNRNKTDKEYILTRYPMLIEKVYDVYIFLLGLYLELAKRSKAEKNPYYQSSLADNRMLIALAENPTFIDAQMRRNAQWDEEQALVNTFFKEAIVENTRYIEYCMAANHSREEDLAILKYLVKNVFLKNETLGAYFDKYHLFWSEDLEVLRAMVSHTFQPYVEEERIILETLDNTWEENKNFFKTLFKKTIEDEKELIDLLTPKLRNWEVERTAETDRILLKMAVTELIEYPSIPVKVTINEIIEIGKNFSTEKSGTFINGVLDSLSKDLIESGQIKKSGRGMLDNK